MDVERYEEVIEVCGELIEELKEKPVDILLTPGETQEIYIKWFEVQGEMPDFVGHYNMRNRAQLKKVVEWLSEDCIEHRKAVEGYDEHYLLKRSECPRCMEALREEAGL